MSDNPHDPMLQNLRRLPALEPDPARADRVRARCRAAMARRRPAAHAPQRASFMTVAVEPAFVGGLCLIYLFAIAFDVLRLLGT